jgi:translation initiation factor 2 beta subunit (eIF-2beta)/eIF-5
MEFLSFLEKDANKQLEESLAIMTKINSEMGKIGEKRKSISTPSGSDTSNAQLVTNYQKLEKAVERQRLAEIKLQQAREKAFDNTIKH